MQDESRARRADNDVDRGEAEPGAGVGAGPDMLTTGLGVAAVVLAAALGLVVFLPTGENPAPGQTVPAVTTTTETTPSTTVASPSTETTTSTTLPLDPFNMPTDIVGPWSSPDGSATATFSSNALTQLDAVVDGGDLGEIQVLLSWPAAIAPVPTATNPSGVVVEALVQINDVRRPARSVAVLLPDDQGLSLRIPLTIDPRLFDLSGSETELTAILSLRPAG